MRLLALFAVAPLAAGALDIKGLKPQMAIDDAKAIISSDEWMSKCRTGMANDPGWSCYYASKYAGRLMPSVPMFETFASRPTESWLLLHDGARLTSVTVQMDNKEFAHVTAALTERWGKPAKTEASTTQNRAGATFDQHVIEWRDGDYLLVARKRAAKLDTMSITLTSSKTIQENAEQRRQQAKDAAKDM